MVCLNIEPIIIKQGEKRVLQFLAPKEQFLECEQKMLQYCKIPGLLKPIFQFYDEMVSMCFDITELEANVNYKTQNSDNYPRQLKAMMDILREHFLDRKGLVVAEEYLFFDKGKNKWFFLFLPFREKSNLQDLSFFRSFFQQQPRIFLQMEMMKENEGLQLEDYLEVI